MSNLVFRRLTLLTIVLGILSVVACSRLEPAGLSQRMRKNVEAATVRIVAQGSFVDPQVGMQQNAAGQGSGFFIDPSGLIVTNNHVVTGAALVKVYRSGEDEPLNARIVGVSECADLAVIDVPGEDFPYLRWYEKPVETGLDVYAAGYPLNDPTFTLTRGVVSKAKASGRTNWSAVEAVVEHDANINPGSSGGPLVTNDGRVLGVNYAGRRETDQQYAISAALARKVVEQLRKGKDIDSIGINGQAIAAEDENRISGIWVASVKSGSPADKAGIQPGDVLTKLEGLVLATDGTMGDYCDILRTHLVSDTLSVEVLRYSTQETLAGQINGRPLAAVTSFARTLASGESESAERRTRGERRFITVTDNTQAIRLQVPADWNDIDGEPPEDLQAAAILAAPDLDAFDKRYDAPGVMFFATRGMRESTRELIDRIPDKYKRDCTLKTVNEYEDPLYSGHYAHYAACGGTDASAVFVVAAPSSQEFHTFVKVHVVTDADLEALDRILRSFQVIGDLP